MTVLDERDTAPARVGPAWSSVWFDPAAVGGPEPIGSVVQLDVVRSFATALPEVEEKPHFRRPAFRVREKLFVSVATDGDAPESIIAHVDHSNVADALAADDAGACEEVWRTHGGRRIFVGVRIELAKAPQEQCRRLVEQAWRDNAPKRLVAAYDAEN